MLSILITQYEFVSFVYFETFPAAISDKNDAMFFEIFDF